jgi:hypothetical protein
MEGAIGVFVCLLVIDCQNLFGFGDSFKGDVDLAVAADVFDVV